MQFAVIKCCNAVHKRCCAPAHEHADKSPVAVADVSNKQQKQHGEQVAFVHVVAESEKRGECECGCKTQRAGMLFPAEEIQNTAETD